VSNLASVFFLKLGDHFLKKNCEKCFNFAGLLIISPIFVEIGLKK
jgi:hypothetical protein